jgi:hypothetical protein
MNYFQLYRFTTKWRIVPLENRYLHCAYKNVFRGCNYLKTFSVVFYQHICIVINTKSYISIFYVLLQNQFSFIFINEFLVSPTLFNENIILLFNNCIITNIHCRYNVLIERMWAQFTFDWCIHTIETDSVSKAGNSINSYRIIDGNVLFFFLLQVNVQGFYY